MLKQNLNSFTLLMVLILVNYKYIHIILYLKSYIKSNLLLRTNKLKYYY